MATPGVILFTSPGVLTDAGGVVLVVGSDGKVHVRRVPGWNPEIMAEVMAAISVINQAGNIKNVDVGRQFQALGESVIQAHGKDIQGYLQQVAG